MIACKIAYAFVKPSVRNYSTLSLKAKNIFLSKKLMSFNKLSTKPTKSNEMSKFSTVSNSIENPDSMNMIKDMLGNMQKQI